MAAAVTAARIEALLLPQKWKDDKAWNGACEELITELRVAEADLKHIAPVPDMTQWTSSERPKWTAARLVLPTGMEFVSPLFAWLCIALWFDATDANVFGLFDVLMRCGCGTVSALGAVTSTGRVVLQFAAAAAFAAVHNAIATVVHVKTRALHLLMAQPNLPLFSAAGARYDPDRAVDGVSGPFCCALCTMMNYHFDAAALEVLLRLTPAQRLAAVDAHSALVRAVFGRCQRTFAVLWNVVRDRVIQPDCNAAELNRIIGGPVWPDGYRRSAFNAATLCGNAYTWRLVTNAHCPLAAALLRHTNAHPQRQYPSPLLLLSETEQTHNERDVRGAWLVSHLCADALNAYDLYGRTPVMWAAHEALPQTLTALLDRGMEVDLTAQPIERKTRTGAVAADALARADTNFTSETAADLLPADDDEEWMTAQFIPIAARLRAETKAQMALRPLIAAAMVPALQQFGGSQMARELVRLCLAYSGLPEPAVWPAPLASVYAGAKRSAAGADGSISGSAGDSAAGSAKPVPKRLRLT